MQALKQTINNFEHTISSFAEYLELWANFDVKPEYQKGYSKEFIAFMLLKAKGELERYTSALAEYREDKLQSLMNMKNELEHIFAEEVVNASGKQIRDILLDTLDCEALIPDLNEYLGLHDYYASRPRRGKKATEHLVEIGCDFILKRDELQLVIDEINGLISTKEARTETSHAWEEKAAQLANIDSAIRQHAQAFKPLYRFIRNLRKNLGDKVLDRRTHWWWFLDEEQTLLKPLSKLAVIFAEGVFEAITATGDLFGGFQLQPAVIHTRGVKRNLYRDFVRMSEKMDWNLYVEVTLSMAAVENNIDVAFFVYNITSRGIKQGIKDIQVEMCTAEGVSLASMITPRSGVVTLGQHGPGQFVIGITMNETKVREMFLEILPRQGYGT